MQAAELRTLYEQLLSLPEELTGEILNGQVHTHPRPSGPHARAASMLQVEIGGPFDRGRGGPGGWWIIIEPEVHFVRDTDICVPNLAGWRRERMPRLPEDQRFERVPDWVCEVLSPATESKDRRLEMPIDPRHGVGFAWRVEPLCRVLQAFALDGNDGRQLGTWRDEANAAVPPFDAIPLELAEHWRR